MTAVRLNPINMSKYHQDMKDAFNNVEKEDEQEDSNNE